VIGKIWLQKYANKFGVWYISGTKHTLAKNVNRGKINDSMIEMLPNIERFLFPHAQNGLFIFSILFSQFSLWLSSLLFPKYIPSELIGLSVQLIPAIFIKKQKRNVSNLYGMVNQIKLKENWLSTHTKEGGCKWLISKVIS
jgi:hypothetical protein